VGKEVWRKRAALARTKKTARGKIRHQRLLGGTGYPERSHEEHRGHDDTLTKKKKKKKKKSLGGKNGEGGRDGVLKGRRTKTEVMQTMIRVQW